MAPLQRIFRRRSTRYSTHMAIRIFIVVGIVVVLEAFSIRHHWRYDTTAKKRYSLSSQSRKVLDGLKEPVKAYAFFQTGDRSRQAAADLLEQYSYYSKLFQMEFIDPDRYPGEAKKYSVTTYNSIVLTKGDRQERVFIADEEKITNGLLKLRRDKRKVVYFLKGHGEKSIEDYGKEGYHNLKIALEEENYEVKELLLMREKEIPGDAAVLIVGGPTKDLFPSELESLKRYIERGGNLLALIDPESSIAIVRFLKKHGIHVGEDVIIDRQSRLFGADYLMPVVTTYGDHPITKTFNLATFFPVARSVEGIEKVKGIEEVKSLAKSSPDSWAETDLEMVQQKKASYEKGKDKKGPVSLAVVATVVSDPTRSQIVVFGDSDFADNSYLNLSGNKDLFMNTLSWLAEEKELISIRPRDTSILPMMLTSVQGRIVFWLPVVMLPLLVLISGIGILSWRRLRQ